MFSSLNIENFRGIKRLEINNIGQVNLLVGTNNSGKTTVLESLFLLTAPVNAELVARVNRFRGIAQFEYYWNILFRDLDIGKKIKMTAKLTRPGEQRELIINPDVKSMPYFVQPSDEDSTEGVGGRFSHSESTLPLNGVAVDARFRKPKSRKWTEYSGATWFEGQNLHFRISKDYEEAMKGRFLNPDIISSVGEIFEQSVLLKSKERVLSLLQIVEPSIKDLAMGPGKEVYADIGLSRLLPVKSLGAGLVKLLAIIAAIPSVEDGVIYIDEIENGLHYTSQRALWPAVFEAARRFNVQVFATTHSLECVKTFSDCCAFEESNIPTKSLFRIERREQETVAIRYDQDMLRTSLEKEWEIR
jgi:energy-coupling factor transporter ATP-binding protein EcfA2